MLTAASTFFSFVFLVSGCVVGALQAATLPLWLLSRRLFRRINAALVQLYWIELLWLVEWYAGYTIDITVDQPATLEALGKESCLILANHSSDLDWLLGWVVAHKFGCLGATKCLLKKELSRMPVLGWSWWFLEYTYLSRQWETDKPKLTRSIQRLRDYPAPYWLCIYAEGTRMTQEKLEASQAHCRQNGLPVFKHIMYPRTKGWSLAASELHNYVDSVLLFVIAFPDGVPSIPDLLRGKPTRVQALIERRPMSQVPTDPEVSAQWCVDAYAEMDAKLAERQKLGDFAGHKAHVPPRNIIWITYYAWATLVALGLAYFLAPLVLSDWRIALTFLVLAYVFQIVVQWINTRFIKKSELKTKAKMAATAGK